MFQRTSTLAVLASGIAALAAANQAQAFVFWSNANGMTSDFMWMGGGSDNGLFGDPTVIGNTFVFTPSGFQANSTNGTAVQVIDRLEVELVAKGAFNFTNLIISEFGDYAITGIGEVSVTGGLFVTDLENLAPPLNILPRVADDSLMSTPGSPITSGAGNWTATAGVDLANWDAGPVWTHIKVVLNNVLIATTEGPGDAAFIEKKVGGVSITIVPTPGSMALFAVGGLVAVRRKR